jgi:hypothetical protein
LNLASLLWSLTLCINFKWFTKWELYWKQNVGCTNRMTWVKKGKRILSKLHVLCKNHQEIMKKLFLLLGIKFSGR